MGVVRLAKSLKLLNSLTEYGSREEDLKNKIHGNRVYMDFVSIVYRLQEKVAHELNYILFSFFLIKERMLDPFEIPILDDLIGKYGSIVPEDIVQRVEKLKDEYDTVDLSNYKIEQSSIYKDLSFRITDSTIDSFKRAARSHNTINSYIYKDVVGFIVDLLTKKITNVEYILISFDGIPSFGKIQEQRQRRYMRYAYKEFEKAIEARKPLDCKIIEDANPKSNADKSRIMRCVEVELDPMAYGSIGGGSNSNSKRARDIKMDLFKLRKLYDADHFFVDIRSAIDYVYNTYHTGELKTDIEKGVGTDQNIVHVEILDRPYGEGEKILMDRLVRDVQVYHNDKSYVFYSPDGDSVLLCLYVYIKTKPEALTVVKTYELNPSDRHNNQCQYVDIRNLYNNIVQTVQKFSGLTITNPVDRDAINRDYVFMMNLYGNDFIHQLPTMEISTTTLDLMYIYSLFIRTESNRYITRIQNNKVHLNTDILVKFFNYLAEYEEYLMLDTYLVNTERRGRISKLFGDIFQHRYLIEYRNTISKMKRELYYTIKPGTKNNKINYAELKQALSDFINKLAETVTVSGKTFASIFKKIEMYDGFEALVAKLSNDPKYLLLDEPRFLYDIKTRENKVESDVIHLVRLAENDLYRSGTSIDLYKIETSRNKELSNFSFDYGNMRDLLPHDQMPTTSNDIDLFMLEWRTGDWRTVLNGGTFELGYDSSTRSVLDVKAEADRYRSHILGMSSGCMDKMVGSYLRTLSWMVDYYMNADIEIDQHTISTWSYNYDRSPMIQHISSYMNKMDLHVLSNTMKNVYQKSLVHTDDYIQTDVHRFYIYPQPPAIVAKIDPKYKKVFPDMDKEVRTAVTRLESIRHKKRQTKRAGTDFFDCRECAYFSKCLIDANTMTFRELSLLQLPDGLNSAGAKKGGSRSYSNKNKGNPVKPHTSNAEYSRYRNMMLYGKNYKYGNIIIKRKNNSASTAPPNTAAP